MLGSMAPDDGRRAGPADRVFTILGLVSSLLVIGLATPASGARASEARVAQETSKTARATLDDTSLHQGQVVTIDGDGWRAGAKVTFTLHPGKHQSETIADSDGRIHGTLKVPVDAPTGDYGLTVEGFGADDLYAYLQNWVTVTSPRPLATLAETALTQGQIVQITGYHWKPDGVVEITLHPGKHQVKVVAGRDRRFAVGFDIPTDAATGKYGITVAGTGSDGHYAYLPNDVTIVSEPASASLDDTTLHPGQTVRVTGRRWKPGEAVEITLHPGKHQVRVPADSAGRIKGSLVIPKSTWPGAYGITVAGKGADGGYAYLQNEVTVSDVVTARRTEVAVDLSPTGPVGGPFPDNPGLVLPPTPSRDTRARGLLPYLILLALIVALVLALLVASSRPGVRRWCRDLLARVRTRLRPSQ